MNLKVDESCFTGESEPATKTDRISENLDNLCFGGTTVVSGEATAVVTATGDNT